MFLLLDETARVLREKRMARGAVDFDFPECKIILDAKGRPVEIKPYERNAATMLIEDCMLAAERDGCGRLLLAAGAVPVPQP